MNSKHLWLGIGVIAIIVAGYFLLAKSTNGPQEPAPNRSDANLIRTPWQWKNTTMVVDGGTRVETIEPEEPSQFVVRFEEDGRMSATTDCNNVSGRYSVDGAGLTFSELTSTRMFCENSLEEEFTDQLSRVVGFLLRDDEVQFLVGEEGIMTLER